MRDQIIEILEDINPDADYETCTTLIDDRYLDSLSMVSLVAELEDTFDITIPAVEVTANNFNSVDAITKLVERLVEEDED
ncbi:MAG: acyl carrier protein [Atopobiaceae bacterium]|nr:acyl carrier protein [Atopobiaceae bacterium]